MSKTKTTTESFLTSFKAFLKGDDDSVLAEKAYRQAQSSLKSHISSYEGDTIDFEDMVTKSKERLEGSKVNFGNPISDRKDYITVLLTAKNDLTDAEQNLQDHLDKISFLKDVLDNQ
ncbi:hypothetical protein Phi40:1_gp024 [Cellulophaga phage phi40:1]|uniref:Uncharacterized protein n=1 Tax=Cellulophaga phage phi38:1 TaxID=1327977 RepID=R9ZXT3_9CAUD|nr:hypothetical protein Phi38:1_gp024 [Cellulophaga phage phi38:1]AGO47889.1 hypothetical protein Phi40:1_gp024 [Cellulophaga phage phi40:1]AGO48054.1 hypothetical protein Phi38:1_gp024 [Cellulophaga phage phi38:1]|tara:strand:+ start:1184 stop:1534 length:351 start_codon:yes stop_codon:yes gene_type:complete